MIIPKDTNYTLFVNFGITETGKTVQYQILNSDLSVRTTYTSTGVQELGYGEYCVVTSFSDIFTGYIRWKITSSSLTASESITITENYIDDISIVKKIEIGRWKMVNNQLILYDEDATTALYTFDLKDSSGSASLTDVTERTPA